MEVIDAVQEQVDMQANSKPNVRTINMDDVRGQHAVPEPEAVPEAEPEVAEQPDANEQVADATDSLMERLGYKKPASPDDTPPEPEPEAEPEPEPVAEEPKAKRKRGRPRKDLSADDIKDIIRETAQSVAPTRDEEPTSPAATRDEVEELNREDLAVFSELELKDPKYSGIRGRYKTYLNSLAEYKQEWQKENSNQTFDPQDPEHEEWTQANIPEFDGRDFDDARIDTKAKRLVRDSERKYMSELESVRSEVAEANMKTELEQGTNGSIAEVVNSVDAGYLKLIQEKGGEALEEADPIAHHVINETLASGETMLYELEKLAHPSKKFRINPNREAHKELIDFAVGKEREIAALPRADRMHEGRQFATTEQWMKMPESKREGHWRLEPQHIKTMYVGDLAKQAKERIESERTRFEKYMGKSSGNKKTQTSPRQPAPRPSRAAKPQPPVTSGEAVSSTAGGDPGKVNLDGHEKLKKYLWG